MKRRKEGLVMKKRNFKNDWALFSYITAYIKPYLGILLLATIALAGNLVLLLLRPYLTKQVIDLGFATNDITMSKYLTPFFNGDFPIVTHVHMGYSFYSHFVKIINTMDVLCDKKEFGYQLAIKSCLLELIHIMIRHPPKTEENKKSEKSVDKIKEILTYMEQHYTEEISIEKIAEICHYSPSHFMKFFKNHMGTSFIKYLNDFRLIKARTRILTTEESILEIAGDCGFNNLSHFNRQYKKKYGITPSMTRGV